MNPARTSEPERTPRQPMPTGADAMTDDVQANEFLRRRDDPDYVFPVDKLPEFAQAVAASAERRPWLPDAILKYLLAREHKQAALEFCRQVSGDIARWKFWIDASRLANELGDRDAVGRFCLHAFQASADPPAAARLLHKLLVANACHDAAVSIWRKVVESDPGTHARLELVRALGRAKMHREQLHEMLELLETCPLSELDQEDQKGFAAALALINDVEPDAVNPLEAALLR